MDCSLSQNRSKLNSPVDAVNIMKLLILVLVRNCPVVTGASPDSRYPNFDSSAVGPSPRIILSPTMSH